VDLRDAGQGLTALGVSQILRRVGLRAGVTGAHNPHSFRHAFAREYLGNGGDLATLADLLGHADIGTTSMYLIFAPNELQRKHDRFSPVPKLDL
jgi:site-specific recombinase XerD